MNDSYQFLQSVLDAVAEHIVVIDTSGEIQFVNQSWTEFAYGNQLRGNVDWARFNYLAVCDEAAAGGDESAAQAAAGIRSAIAGQAEFYFEYPCHAPDQLRWFIMRVVPFTLHGTDYLVLSHQDITERKLAEEAVVKLSRMDGLTGAANRRYFDEFFDDEWRRCARVQAPLSLAIVDIDHFKKLNDNYGHMVGDECLKAIAKLLGSYMRRPSDLCARFGGDELVLVFGNMPGEQAKLLCEEILSAVRRLDIAELSGSGRPQLTISIGLADIMPGAQVDTKALITEADDKLYQAKDAGRDRLMY